MCLWRDCSHHTSFNIPPYADCCEVGCHRISTNSVCILRNVIRKADKRVFGVEFCVVKVGKFRRTEYLFILILNHLVLDGKILLNY